MAEASATTSPDPGADTSPIIYSQMPRRKIPVSSYYENHGGIPALRIRQPTAKTSPPSPSDQDKKTDRPRSPIWNEFTEDRGRIICNGCGTELDVAAYATRWWRRRELLVKHKALCTGSPASTSDQDTSIGSRNEVSMSPELYPAAPATKTVSMQNADDHSPELPVISTKGAKRPLDHHDTHSAPVTPLKSQDIIHGGLPSALLESAGDHFPELPAESAKGTKRPLDYDIQSALVTPRKSQESARGGIPAASLPILDGPFAEPAVVTTRARNQEVHSSSRPVTSRASQIAFDGGLPATTTPLPILDGPFPELAKGTKRPRSQEIQSAPVASRTSHGVFDGGLPAVSSPALDVPSPGPAKGTKRPRNHEVQSAPVTSRMPHDAFDGGLSVSHWPTSEVPSPELAAGTKPKRNQAFQSAPVASRTSHGAFDGCLPAASSPTDSEDSHSPELPVEPGKGSKRPRDEEVQSDSAPFNPRTSLDIIHESLPVSSLFSVFIASSEPAKETKLPRNIDFQSPPGSPQPSSSTTHADIPTTADVLFTPRARTPPGAIYGETPTETAEPITPRTPQRAVYGGMPTTPSISPAPPVSSPRALLPPGSTGDPPMSDQAGGDLAMDDYHFAAAGKEAGFVTPPRKMRKVVEAPLTPKPPLTPSTDAKFKVLGSSVWRYFDRNGEDVSCNICDEILAIDRSLDEPTQSWQLWRHLDIAHPLTQPHGQSDPTPSPTRRCMQDLLFGDRQLHVVFHPISESKRIAARTPLPLLRPQPHINNESPSSCILSMPSGRSNDSDQTAEQSQGPNSAGSSHFLYRTPKQGSTGHASASPYKSSISDPRLKILYGGRFYQHTSLLNLELEKSKMERLIESCTKPGDDRSVVLKALIPAAGRGHVHDPRLRSAGSDTTDTPLNPAIRASLRNVQSTSKLGIVDMIRIAYSVPKAASKPVRDVIRAIVDEATRLAIERTGLADVIKAVPLKLRNVIQKQYVALTKMRNLGFSVQDMAGSKEANSYPVVTRALLEKGYFDSIFASAKPKGSLKSPLKKSPTRFLGKAGKFTKTKLKSRFNIVPKTDFERTVLDTLQKTKGSDNFTQVTCRSKLVAVVRRNLGKFSNVLSKPERERFCTAFVNNIFLMQDPKDLETLPKGIMKSALHHRKMKVIAQKLKDELSSEEDLLVLAGVVKIRPAKTHHMEPRIDDPMISMEHGEMWDGVLPNGLNPGDCSWSHFS